MSAPARKILTPEEYLELERAAEYRSEYLDGEMFAMAGGGPMHSLIALNTGATLRALLRGRGCRVFSSDLRVKVSATGLYTYPDAIVVCGETRLEDGHRDTLLNPTLIVEVLSPSTEAYDRGRKFAHYQSVPSLREYVLVSQDRPRVERFTREEGAAEWRYAECSEPEGALRLASVDCELPLAEVYDTVEFA